MNHSFRRSALVAIVALALPLAALPLAAQTQTQKPPAAPSTANLRGHARDGP